MFKFEEEAATVYVGGIAPAVTEALLFELFSQVGPVAQVRIPAPPAHKAATTSRLRARLDVDDGGEVADKEDAVRISSLRPMFEPFGDVLAFDCVSARDAFVVFSDSMSCQNAAARLDGMALGAQTLRTCAAPLVDHRFGFVTFDCPESVLYATRVFNGLVLCEKQLSVEKRTAKAEEEEDAVDQAVSDADAAVGSDALAMGASRGFETAKRGNVAVVYNLCPTLTHVDVRDLLEWAARDSVMDMKLARMLSSSSSSSRSARQATVTFESEGGAERALAALHGDVVRGLELKVEIV